MADDYEMRARLQQVAAYRDLCRRIRRSGRENIIFASIMLFLAYMAWQRGMANIVLIIYILLASGELFVGLFKWLLPSAEGVLLDGIVLLVFAGFNLMGYLVGRPPPMWVVLLAVFLLYGAIGRFKDYGLLRRLFAERPNAEHMAWFDELAREIQASDPQSDELALDLPTTPHWKAKLLGSTVFFVADRGGTVLVAGPDDFELLREKTDRGTGRRKALLRVYGLESHEFEITDATWSNYQKWRAAYPLPGGPPTAVGERE